jgi:hypothetical protein
VALLAEAKEKFYYLAEDDGEDWGDDEDDDADDDEDDNEDDNEDNDDEDDTRPSSWWRTQVTSSTTSTEQLIARRGIKEQDFDCDGLYLQFVAFLLPASCANKRDGCDWVELGYGVKLDDGTLLWCCSANAVDLGFRNET